MASAFGIGSTAFTVWMLASLRTAASFAFWPLPDVPAGNVVQSCRPFIVLDWLFLRVRDCRGCQAGGRAATGLALMLEALDRRGTHPAFGPVTARQLVAAWVVHDLGHLPQVAKAMAFQYRDAVGPWREYLTILPRVFYPGESARRRLATACAKPLRGGGWPVCAGTFRSASRCRNHLRVRRKRLDLRDA